MQRRARPTRDELRVRLLGAPSLDRPGVRPTPRGRRKKKEIKKTMKTSNICSKKELRVSNHTHRKPSSLVQDLLLSDGRFVGDNDKLPDMSAFASLQPPAEAGWLSPDRLISHDRFLPDNTSLEQIEKDTLSLRDETRKDKLLPQLRKDTTEEET